MIQKALPLIRRLLELTDMTIAFVDVGSRNGVVELSDLAPFVDAVGFEPNPVEYQKLVTNTTDAFRIAGIASPRYRSLQYFPYALSDHCGRATFFLTPGPGACGLLEPDVDRLREIVWKGRRYKRNFGDDVFASHEQIEVEVRTLDSLAADRQLDHIDYLKIDVEGSEWEMLMGARSMLPRTGVVKVETCFIPFRKGQRLFSHVDLVLREFGFDLLHYEVDQAQIGYRRRTAPIQPLPYGYADPYGQPLSCDAIYVNRGVSDRRRALAQAAILLDKNYIDESLYIFEARAGMGDEAICDLLRHYSSGVTTGQWLRGVGYQWVDRLVGAAGRLTRIGRS